MPYKAIPLGYCFGETRAALFARKGYQPARALIQKGSRYNFTTSGLPMCCFFCGYDRHVDVAHRRGVMSFPETTLIGEINDLRNLIPLCPNHHREADSGMIDLATVETLGERFGYYGFIPAPNFARGRRKHQRGSIVLKPRRKGPDVWVFRYMSDGKHRSVVLGSVETYPFKELAEGAAQSIRMSQRKEFSHIIFPQRTVRLHPSFQEDILET